MKKKILTGLGAIIFFVALILNVSIAKDNNSLVLNKLGTIALAEDEDISEGGDSGGTQYSGYTDWITCSDPDYSAIKRCVYLRKYCSDQRVMWIYGYSFCHYKSF